MAGYIATIGAATGWLSETEENLNGTEICKIFLPNVPANRTIVATDGNGSLRWAAGPTLFEGTYTGAVYAKDVLEVSVIPTVYYTMVYKAISGDYVSTPAADIFDDICTEAGVNGSWTSINNPTVSVKFIRASCLDAANFLADIANSDRWSVKSTNTFIIGPRGLVKGSLTVVEDTDTTRTKDRKGMPNIIYVRGTDAAGKYIEGLYDDGLGSKVKTYTEKKASSESTLDLLAKKYYDQSHTEDGPSTITIRLDQAQNVMLGDTWTLPSASLGLSGGYRISKIVRRLDSVQISITSPNKSLEQKVLDLKKYEDFGIYVTAGVLKTMQNWSSDIVVTSVDWDTATWSPGTIKFADGDTQAINSGTTGNLGAAGVYFLYFTLDSPTMQITADYNVAVSQTTAIFAKLTVSTDVTQKIAIEAPNAVTTTKVNREMISEDSIFASAMRPGIQPYQVDITFSPKPSIPWGDEHHIVQWTAGTVTFADGSTWALNIGDSHLTSIPDGSFRWLYFSTGSHDIAITSNYADAVGDTTGLLAKVYVSLRTEQEIMIVPYKSKGENWIVDAMAAKCVDTEILTSMSIYGKDIATDINVGTGMGNAGLRMIGEDADIIGTAIGDGSGEVFAAGIYGFSEVGGDIYRGFYLDPDGVISVYAHVGGASSFRVVDENFDDIGWLVAAGYSNAARAMILYTNEDDAGVGLESNGYAFVLGPDGTIIVSSNTMLNLNNGRLVIPVRSGYTPTESGEIWFTV